MTPPALYPKTAIPNPKNQATTKNLNIPFILNGVLREGDSG